MKKVYTPQEGQEIEKAIIFMVERFRKENRNEKPVILHSIKVGMTLMEEDAEKDLVVAGILHDLIEDSDVTEEEIAKRFGEKVAVLVETMTMDYSYIDYKERWLNMIEKLKKIGKDAMLLKTADALNNLYYVDYIKKEDKKKEVLWKHISFYTIAQKYIGDILLFQRYEKVFKNKLNALNN